MPTIFYHLFSLSFSTLQIKNLITYANISLFIFVSLGKKFSNNLNCILGIFRITICSYFISKSLCYNAPPIMTSVSILFSFTRFTTFFISIIVVVISAERPIISALCSFAASMIVSAGTSFPRSITS